MHLVHLHTLELSFDRETLTRQKTRADAICNGTQTKIDTCGLDLGVLDCTMHFIDRKYLLACLN